MMSMKGRGAAVPPAANEDTSLRVTVLAGGPGAEREVSLESGRTVHAALLRLGYQATLSDITPDDLSALCRATDFYFIALHGEFGEDGTLQKKLDELGVPYSGSGAAASRLAMNKASAKRRLEGAGIPTPAYVVVRRENVDSQALRVGWPAVVKPLSSGSSVDTTIARTASDVRRAAMGLMEKYGEALIERYIQGPELTIGILGEEALPVCEIRTKREFYDYQAKYLDDDTQYLFDLDIPTAILRRVQELAAKAHRALGCEVFSRVDCMLDGATAAPYFLEVNTIPGFTSHSLVPKAAARVGLNFDALCQRIIELSLDLRSRVPNTINDGSRLSRIAAS